LIVGNPDGTRIYDTTRNQIDAKMDDLFPVGLADRGETLVLVGEAAVEFWSTTDWQLKKSIALGEGPWRLAWQRVMPRIRAGFSALFDLSPDGRTLATPASVGQVQIWRLSEADGIQEQVLLTPHKRLITGLQFSPDGERMGTSAEDGSAYLFETKSWDQVFHLRGHLKAVHSLSFSRDGRRVATGGGDRDAVKIWDVATGQEVLTLAANGTLISPVRFAPDGNSLAAVSWNSGKPVLHVWRAPTLAETQSNDPTREEPGRD
jgi:WD40 repeat protein